MAHYIAECITLAETASGPRKRVLQQQCHESILALWEKRNSLPDGLRPFQGFEPIFRSLAAIDLDNPHSNYIPSLCREKWRSPAHRKKKADKFVEFVIAVDSAARSVIEYSVESAVEAASTPALLALLSEARALASGADIDLLIRLVQPAGDDPNEIESHLNAEVRRNERRLATLDHFQNLLEQVRPLLEARLEKARRVHHKAARKASRLKRKPRKGKIGNPSQTP